VRPAKRSHLFLISIGIGSIGIAVGVWSLYSVFVLGTFSGVTGPSNVQPNGGSTCAPSSGADCSFADLAYADLGGVDLSRADLTGANLRRANLQFADLENASLRNAILAGANFQNANLLGADLSGTDLSKAFFCNTVMPGGWISDADCSG